MSFSISSKVTFQKEKMLTHLFFVMNIRMIKYIVRFNKEFMLFFVCRFLVFPKFTIFFQQPFLWHVFFLRSLNIAVSRTYFVWETWFNYPLEFLFVSMIRLTFKKYNIVLILTHYWNTVISLFFTTYSIHWSGFF